MRKFIALVGTNSRLSTNRQLLEFMKKYFPNNVAIELVELGNLPMFDKPLGKALPQEVLTIAQKINEVDGVIISAPEYDHAVPAVLMNALEWLSFGIHPFLDKPVMVIGASFGALGTSRAQAHLRQILDSPELQARIMPSSEFLVPNSLQAFDQAGVLMDANTIEKLISLVADFQEFIDLNRHLKHGYLLDQAQI